MKRLNGMKTQNKWMFLTAGIVLCLVAGFTSTSQVVAAGENPGSLDYLDPFTLTVTPLSSTEATSADPLLETLLMGSTESSSSPYVPPAKIWIPYRPTFRSPCTPSW